MLRSFVITALLVLGGCRHVDGPLEEPTEAASPYVTQSEREIKALSAERIRGLLAGEGLGYALAAELNGYPGPRHVLDLADSLKLTPEQRQAVGAAFLEMRNEAVAAGRYLVSAEAELDSLFAHRLATEDQVREMTRKAALLDARVRNAHLVAHVRTTSILRASQIEEYARLRGYRSGPDHAHGMHH